MKHIVLLGLAIFSTALQVQAQSPDAATAPQTMLRRPGLAPIDAKLRQLDEAGRAVTVRKYTRSTGYTWVAASNRWTTTPSASALTYNAQALLQQAVSTDSATKAPTNRISYTYNSANQAKTYLSENWSNGAWVNASQTLWAYDSQGFMSEQVQQTWTNGAWVNTYRYQYAYDSRGNQTFYVFQRWTNGAWVTSSGYRISYTYDAQNRVSEEIDEDWYTPTGTFVRSARYLYAYVGATNNYSSFIYQVPNNNDWINQQRTASFVYDAQNRMVSSLTEDWLGNGWGLYFRSTIAYSANNSYVALTEILNGNTWVNSSRMTQNYDASGFTMGNFTELWTNGAWQLSSGSRNLQATNSTGDVIWRVAQRVDATTHAFVNSSKFYYYDFQTITLANKTQQLQAQAQLYPNPTTRTATLELGDVREQGPVAVTVLNALGQPVQQLSARAQQGRLRLTVDVSSLPAGVYSIQARTAEGTVVKRLVRQ